MKIQRMYVPPEEIPAELVRRRAEIIDALVAELRLREFRVEHDPSAAMRERRTPEEGLTETVVVEGTPVAVRVRRRGCSDRLVFRCCHDGDRWPSLERTEADGGFDVFKLTDAVVEIVRYITEKVDQNVLFKERQETARHMTEMARVACDLTLTVEAYERSDNNPRAFRVNVTYLTEEQARWLVAAITAAFNEAVRVENGSVIEQAN